VKRTVELEDYNLDYSRPLQLGRLGDFIGFRLRRVQNHLAKDFQVASRRFNLKSGLFSSLALIAANPGVSQNQVSQAVGLDKSVTVQIIKELEKRGFVRRKRSDVDRRRYALFVTGKGEKFLNQLFTILTETEHNALQQISKSELNLLKALLDRIYEVL